MDDIVAGYGHVIVLTKTQLTQPGPYARDDNSEAVNVKVRSYDGTFLYPSSTRRESGWMAHPTLLIGYGAYGTVTVRPAFAGPRIAWTERGGVLAECAASGMFARSCTVSSAVRVQREHGFNSVCAGPSSPPAREFCTGRRRR